MITLTGYKFAAICDLLDRCCLRGNHELFMTIHYNGNTVTIAEAPGAVPALYKWNEKKTAYAKISKR